MKATVVDLRYRMNKVLKALDRNEDVSILYHGKIKGVLTARTHCSGSRVCGHPFFNMRHGKDSVDAEIGRLRGGRYRDL